MTELSVIWGVMVDVQISRSGGISHFLAIGGIFRRGVEIIFLTTIRQLIKI